MLAVDDSSSMNDNHSKQVMRDLSRFKQIGLGTFVRSREKACLTSLQRNSTNNFRVVIIMTRHYKQLHHERKKITLTRQLFYDIF